MHKEPVEYAHTFELQEQQHVKQSNKNWGPRNRNGFIIINSFDLKLTVFIKIHKEPQSSSTYNKETRRIKVPENWMDITI
jgi:hypothetical protein